LFHQWFGDLVTCESWANLPLNESFANYSELLWQEHLNGTDALEMQLYEEMGEYMGEAESKREPMIRYYYKDKEEMFDRHSYSKGAVLLHMLRKTVGDEAFFTALKLYLKKFAYKKAEIHDLRMVFEEVTGEDLNWFFDQWFLQAGHPKLTVKHSYNTTTKKIQLTVNQEHDLRYTPLYRLPLYVDIWVKGKKNRYAVVIDEQKEVFEWEAAAQPELVFFDGETQLLGEITHEKTMAEYVFQYKNSEKPLARLEALQQLMKNEDFLQYEDVFLSALNDKVWELRMMAANVFDKYEGQNAEVLGAKLQALIENDKKSLVRATAISTLASFGANKYTDLFRRSLNDSSYAVVANALYAYYATGSPDAGEQFEKHENVDNLNITITVADYFASFKKRNKYDWFIRKMDRLQQSGGVTYLFVYFTQYLLNDEANLVKGADYLQNIAAKHSNYQVRIMAFQNLQLLPVKDIQQRKEQLKKEEKDQRVQEAYK
jgi:aminopeptidase N